MRMWAPEWKTAAEIDGVLPNMEYNAHLHRLDKCGITLLQHERQAAEARIDKTDSARERHYRKRPKKRAIGRARTRRRVVR